MAFSTKLELRQGQQLVMTPQLQQAIRLLQLSNLELSAYVDTELERNPLLERDEGAERSEARTIDTPEEPERPEAAAGAEEEPWLDLAKPDADVSGAVDADVRDVFPDTAPSELGIMPGDSGWASVRGTGGSFEDDEFGLESFATAELSLRDHLSAQLHIAFPDGTRRIIGQHLVDLVDDAGYLAGDPLEIAEKLGAPLTLVEDVLARCQSFDPPGIMARSLAECLALQLKDQNRYDPQIAKLLDNLHLLGAHNLAALKKAVGVEMDELADMIAEIKRLTPKPGLKFGSVHLQPVVPDVFVRPAADGSWILELNSDTLPRVLVNRSYYARVTKTARNPKDKDYLSECLQTANWLVKSLDQRARTILRVSQEIVRQQDAFFTHGVQYLRPLNLKTVADAISMHESTVSRVTSNKYISSPRGILELKYFFTSAIASANDGEAHSSESVRFRIKQLIDAEKPANVLSDDRLVDILKDEGIDIARRTVAKYREALRIPSSVQRRREKQMEAQVAKAG